MSKYLRIAVNCGDPTSNITNMNNEFETGTKPNPTTYQSSSTLRCRAEYKYADGSSSKSINCQANGAWSSFTTCQSMLMIIYKLYCIISLN